ncbi:unnamed protein product [Durusdinium trenchii]|uniref:Uncharacterized protein n=1 Tax=Durusdinium trenchii TaxID=1381693 RepID=A0ABP0JBY5_9DINO
MADFLAVVPKVQPKEPLSAWDHDAQPRTSTMSGTSGIGSASHSPTASPRIAQSSRDDVVECQVRTLSDSDLALLMPQVLGHPRPEAIRISDQKDNMLSVPGSVILKISEEDEASDEHSEQSHQTGPMTRVTRSAPMQHLSPKPISAGPAADVNIPEVKLSGLMPSYGASARSLGTWGQRQISHNSQLASPVGTLGQRQISHNSQIRTSTYAVSKTLKSKADSSDRISFQEGVEPSMQMYLADHCIDGLGSASRWKTSLTVMIGTLLLLPILSFSVLLVPLAPPEKGFHANWVFNYLVHPVLNYVVCRAELEVGIRRPLAVWDRQRVCWIVQWVPLVGCLACLFIHFVGSLFGIYPMPFAVSTSCIPSAWVTLYVASYLVPEDLLTADLRAFVRFAYMELLFWALQFAVLLVWLLIFPILSVPFQLLSSVAVTGMLTGAGWAVNKIGRRYLGVPEYITEEAKVFILFIAFLFSAALLSSAKNGLVLGVMLILDAGKALAIALKTCHCLINLLKEQKTVEVQEVESATNQSGISMIWTHCRALPCRMKEKWRLAWQLRSQLKEILSDLAGKTRESLQESEINVLEAQLINEFARHIKLLALVELCEIAVPLMYMLVMALLHSETFGYNRQYFQVLSTTAGFEDAMTGNALSLLIEAFVFIGAQIVLMCSMGFDLVYFAGIAVRENYSYWVFALSTCCEKSKIDQGLLRRS